MSQELVIEKKSYGFRLVLGEESYFIKDNGDWYTMAIEKEREVVDFVNDRYENLGTKDINELLCKMITTPQNILEMLLGEKPEIEKIIVEFD